MARRRGPRSNASARHIGTTAGRSAPDGRDPPEPKGKRPRSIRRKLARDKQRETYFRRNTNHVLAQRYVATAKGTGRGIALEQLQGGLRDRITARGADQRHRLSGWAFFQLRQFLDYKARWAGVPVVYVDPHHTSRTCPECGHCEKANRKSQSVFEYRSCEHRAHAALVGTRNIRARALVMRSEGVGKPTPAARQTPASTGTSPRLEVGAIMALRRRRCAAAGGST
ncbi:MAG: transposase [Isosphaeraceae bacterium]|nr:transposase [Isosphaeraceae bacterium]